MEEERVGSGKVFGEGGGVGGGVVIPIEVEAEDGVEAQVEVGWVGVSGAR